MSLKESTFDWLKINFKKFIHYEAKKIEKKKRTKMFRPSLSIFAHLLLVSKISLGSRSALHEIVIGNRTATGTFQLIFLNCQKYRLKLFWNWLSTYFQYIFNTIFKILKSLKKSKALSFSWKHFHSNMSILSDEIVIKHCLKWILSLYIFWWSY